MLCLALVRIIRRSRQQLWTAGHLRHLHLLLRLHRHPVAPPLRAPRPHPPPPRHRRRRCCLMFPIVYPREKTSSSPPLLPSYPNNVVW